MSGRTLATGSLLVTLLGSALHAQPIEMVMTNEIATSHWTAQLMEEFAETLRERAEGRIDPQIFHGATLYADRDAVAALGTGAVHMVWPVSVQIESIAPEYGVINLPFAISDDLMMRPEAAEAVAEFLSQYLEDRGIRVMGLMRTADLVFLYRDKEITRPEDLQGDRIRLTGGRVLQAMMQEFGANPVTMPASEMATALMQGAIDGIFTSAGGWQMVGVNAAGVASLVPGLSLLTYTVLVDDAWLQGLPEDLREIIETTTAEMLETQWADGLASDKATMQAMLDAGGRLVVVEGDAHEAFRERAERASRIFIDQHPEVWRAFQEVVAPYRD
jgi:C4-dicarboxylate-binding protein DctP